LIVWSDDCYHETADISDHPNAGSQPRVSGTLCQFDLPCDAGQRALRSGEITELTF
jgi:hypothetical protein